MAFANEIASNLLTAGRRLFDQKVALARSPSALQSAKVRGVNAVLEAAGVTQGLRPVDHAVVAAIELQGLVMSLVTTTDPIAVMAEGIGTMAYLGHALAEEAEANGDVVSFARRFGPKA
jgi:hypothetical protein